MQISETGEYDNKFLASFFGGTYPTNTPRVFHFETTWKRMFSRRFNVEYTWSVNLFLLDLEKKLFKTSSNCLQIVLSRQDIH